MWEVRVPELVALTYKKALIQASSSSSNMAQSARHRHEVGHVPPVTGMARDSAARLQLQLVRAQLLHGPSVGPRVRIGAPRPARCWGSSLPGAGTATARLLGHRNSLWPMVRRLHPRSPREAVPTHQPELEPEPPSLSCQLAPGPAPLLLLVREGLPVDEDESAEDEEHASPPQHLPALSVQHKAQGGLRDRQR